MDKAELRTYFKDILNNTECTDALADRFIDTSIRRIQRVTRLPSMEEVASYTVPASGYEGVPIPDGYLQIIDLWLDSGAQSRKLSRVAFADWIKVADDGDSPCVYYRKQGFFLPRPTPVADTVFQLNYYEEFPALASETSVNFLTEAAPEIVTYGALSFAADYFTDMRKGAFEGGYKEMLMDLQAQADVDEVAGRDLAIQPLHVDY